MTPAEFGGLVRTIAAAASGWVIATGLFNAEQWLTISGALGVVAVAVWSWWQKKQAAKA